MLIQQATVHMEIQLIMIVNSVIKNKAPVTCNVLKWFRCSKKKPGRTFDHLICMYVECYRSIIEFLTVLL